METRAKKSLTIKNEIFLLSFLFLALVSLIFAGLFLKILYEHNMDNARNSLRQCNSQIVTYTEGMFHENASIVKLLSANPVIINRGDDPSDVLSIYDTIRENNTNITYIYSGYADGKLYIGDYDTPTDYDPGSRPWYQAAKNTDDVARLVYRDAVTKEWLFSQCKKLVDSEGNMVGAVAIDCSNTSISEALSTRYQYESQRSYIIAPDGTVLIHPEEQYINDSLTNYMEEDVWEAVVHGRSNYGEYKKDKVNAMAYFERIPETEFIVVTAIDASEITRPIVRSVEYLLALVACLCILLSIILSQILMYRFARPIIALENRIKKVAGGYPVNGHEFIYSNVEINGIANSIEIIVKNIAKREEQRKTAEYLSFHDSMTGLYNRRYFVEELQHMDTKSNYPLCIVCCDINGLKQINDVFGHDAGDELIGKVASCLKRSCRSDDVLARLGGDEFSVIMPRVTEAGAEQILKRIESELAKENICTVEVTASLGYAVKDREEVVLEEVRQRADQMMYTKKMRESTKVRRNMLNSIITAAEREGLVNALTDEENRVLTELAAVLCPTAEKLLKESYWLRNIGLCSLFPVTGSADEINRRHTETGYRVLCVFDKYRSVAGCVLHYTEHWDGSGWPAGMSGRDIPLISRIIAVAAACFEAGGTMEPFNENRGWYDPAIVAVLTEVIS